jgi:alginate O-acetyltransferase complex protein AlgI
MMLFNSVQFIFLFLPITFVGFAAFVRTERLFLAKAWLCLASVVFYGSFNIRFVPILFASIAVNYLIVRLLLSARGDESRTSRLLAIGVSANLLSLFYFKYFNFFVDTVASLARLDVSVAKIILPLGISFYTFQKIALLIDVAGGAVKEIDFIDYCLFALFFPQLINGPLVHHREVVPQYKALGERAGSFGPDNIAKGLTLFTIGLCKKVVLADGIAHDVGPSIDRVFSVSGLGSNISFFEAWGATLSYGLQLYFDFSGYSDMAIGLGLLFGIRMPLNFNSPFKSVTIVDYWSRWHMSLTRFLTAYVYNPMRIRMSRSRLAAGKTLIAHGTGTIGAFSALIAWPSLYTMFLAGIWHGAGWQYVCFGLLHGMFLGVCHGYDFIKKRMRLIWTLPTVIAILLTYACANMGFLFFRAQNVKVAGHVLAGISGVNGFVLPKIWEAPLGNVGRLLSHAGVTYGSAGTFDRTGKEVIWVVCLQAIVFFMPNSQEIMGLSDRKQMKEWWWRWRPNAVWLTVAALGVFVAIPFLRRVSEFIYFQF